MTAHQATAVPTETPPQPTERRATAPRERNKPKHQPRYAVVLHNDDVNSMEHVVGVLRKVFHYGRVKAIGLMLSAHISGRSIVWTGSLEVAELKADQIRSCGPDPRQPSAPPLGVSIEPLPE